MTKSWLWAVLACATALAGALALNALARRAVPFADLARTKVLHDGGSLPVVFIRNVNGSWIFFAVLVVTLLGASVLSMRACKYAAEGGAGPRAVPIIQGVVCIALTVCAFTISGDVYLFILWGRMYGVHDVSPYLWSARITAADATVARILSGYGLQPAADDYGPLWTLFESALSRVEANLGVGLQVWTHRLLMIGAAVAATLGLTRLSRTLPTREQTARAALFAFNPLTMYECAVEAHNDMLIVAMGVWAFAVADALPLVAALLLGGAIAMKFVPVIVAPFLLIKLVRKHGWRTAALGIVVASAVVALSLRPFWVGGALFNSLAFRLAAVTGSPQWLAQTLWRWAVGWSPQFVFAAVAVALFLLVVAFAAWRFRADGNGIHIWRTITAGIWAMPGLNPEIALWLSPAMALGNRAWRVYTWWLATLALGYYAIFLSRPPESLAIPSAATLAFVIGLIVAPIVIARYRGKD